MKKYLYVIVTRKDGTTFPNHLKLSEVHLLSKIAQDNGTEMVTVKAKCTGIDHYKQMFG
jgi:hypothetical protein